MPGSMLHVDLPCVRDNLLLHVCIWRPRPPDGYTGAEWDKDARRESRSGRRHGAHRHQRRSGLLLLYLILLLPLLPGDPASISRHHAILLRVTATLFMAGEVDEASHHLPVLSLVAAHLQDPRRTSSLQTTPPSPTSYTRSPPRAETSCVLSRSSDTSRYSLRLRTPPRKQGPQEMRRPPQRLAAGAAALPRRTRSEQRRRMRHPSRRRRKRKRRKRRQRP